MQPVCFAQALAAMAYTSACKEEVPMASSMAFRCHSAALSSDAHDTWSFARRSARDCASLASTTCRRAAALSTRCSRSAVALAACRVSVKYGPAQAPNAAETRAIPACIHALLEEEPSDGDGIVVGLHLLAQVVVIGRREPTRRVVDRTLVPCGRNAGSRSARMRHPRTRCRW